MRFLFVVIVLLTLLAIDDLKLWWSGASKLESTVGPALIHPLDYSATVTQSGDGRAPRTMYYTAPSKR